MLASSRLSRAITLCTLLLMVCALPHAALAQSTITIAEARQQGDGSSVVVEGVVTRAFGAYVRIQDESGPTGASGLVIRQTSGNLNDAIANGTVAPGTLLRVDGTLSEFNDLLQIDGDGLTSYTVVDQTAIPDPQVVTLEDLTGSGDDYESELVEVVGISFQTPSGSFAAGTNYGVADNTGAITLRIQQPDETRLIGEPVPSDPQRYQGIVGQFRGENQLIPVETTDLQPIESFAFSRAYAIAEETDGSVTVNVRAFNVPDGQDAQITVRLRDAGNASYGTDVSGPANPTTLTFNGPDPAPQTLTYTLAQDADDEPVERIEVELSSTDAAVSSPSVFTLWILDDPTSQGPVATGLEGGELLQTLEETFGNPATLGYDVARDTMYRTIYNDNGTVESFYATFTVPVDPDGGDASNQALNGGINTEHIFPQSLGAGEEPARSNMHILVPARAQVNTARSNFPFADIPDANTDTWFFDDQQQSTPPMSNIDAWSELDSSPPRDDRRFEPREAVKGDVARAIFYFVMAYPDRADIPFLQAQKSTLLQWHADDPVDATEMRRNLLQASYQENKLNPFIVDPTLVNRAFGVLTEPLSVSATSGGGSVQVRWDPPIGGEVTGYNVYRSTQPFTSIQDALQITASPVTDTQFSDNEAEVGGIYTYRITAVDGSGTEGPLSEAASVSLYPSTVSFSVDVDFPDLASPSSYRLVALPGDIDRALGDALGEPGVDWTAFWDDGTDTDFLTRFDGSETFRFAPGRGFWLLSSANWAVDDVVASVPLSGGAVSIPLHDGWNIISNPFPVGVRWADVDAENGATTLQPLWSWSGSFQQADVFSSAATGEAFYFFNDSGLTELTIPLAPASLASEAPAPVSLQRAVTLDVQQASGAAGTASHAASVQVAESSEAANGRDPLDYIAPRTSFEAVSLHLLPGRDAKKFAKGSRRSTLAREVRAPSANGHSYRLTLNAKVGAPVTITPSSLPADPNVRVILARTDTGARYDLRNGVATITPAAKSTDWTLLVGTDSFVKGTAPEPVTEIAVEPPSPNPFRQQTTLRYVLPEANEVTVRVYDVLGRRIHTLMDRQQPSGAHQLQWNGTSGSGGPVASGMYFLRVRIGDTPTVHKVVHVR